MKDKKPIIVCRPLFYTIIKYFYIVFLGLTLLLNTLVILFNDNSFIVAVGSLIAYLIGFAIMYLFFNWLYKCILKTMLALTDKELHFEFYRPFVKYESTIPLDSIKKVTTVEFFWIFRAIIIHQYHKFPIIFPTWNNKEMKDEINELIIKEKEHVLNDGKTGGIISKGKYKLALIITGSILGGLVLLSGIVHLINYFGDLAYQKEHEKYAGTYESESGYGKDLTLYSNGTCEYGSYDECTWTETDDEGYVVNVIYEYEAGYYYTYTDTDSFTAVLDIDDKTYEEK